jgi:hypothetical protein
MDFPDILSSIAGASVTLAGFAAAFKAFTRGHDPDGQDRVRLNIVIEGGLVISVVCFSPITFAGLQVPDDISWRLGSAMLMSWVALRILWTAGIIVKTIRPLPVLFSVAVPLAVFGFLAGLANVSTMSTMTAYSLFLTAVLLQFASTATVFVAQFQAEQEQPENQDRKLK